MKPDLSDACIVVGALAITFGLYLIAWPLVPVFYGLLLMAAGIRRS